MATKLTGSEDTEQKDQVVASTSSGNTSGAGGTQGSASSENTPEARRAQAVQVVERFTWWSGGAGLIPVPLLDVVAVGGVQLQMLRRLSHIYDVPFSENRGKSLIASLAGSMIPTSSGIGFASLFKSVPVVGTIVSSIVVPTLSAGATYAIGMVFIEHFASGGTLLDFNPPDYREFFKSQKELWTKRFGGTKDRKSTESSTGATASS